MRRPASLFAIVLALAAVMLVTGAQAAPKQITGCQNITESGSYVLANNLPSVSGPLLADGSCLLIRADFVTINLAGFLISGQDGAGKGIAAEGRDVSVRNGTIFDFDFGVDLGEGSIVEELRVVNISSGGIRVSSGVVRGNSVRLLEGAPGISVTGNGTVTGNYVTTGANPGIDVGSGSTVSGNTANENTNGIRVGSGSTVIGNTVGNGLGFGISATCPSNVTNNTALNNGGGNIVLNGTGCISTNNVMP